MSNAMSGLDIEIVENEGLNCASCHQAIEPTLGVVFGRPGLAQQAISVCIRCIKRARLIMIPQIAKERSAKP